MVFIGVGHGSSVIFFRIRSQNDMYSWNTNKNFLQENFMIARQNKDCRMITHVHFDCRGVMWILESNIQDFVIDDVGCFGPSIMLMPVYDIPIAIPNNYNISENECINDEFWFDGHSDCCFFSKYISFYFYLISLYFNWFFYSIIPFNIIILLTTQDINIDKIIWIRTTFLA